MKILITNDDGIHALGIRHLADAVADFGEVKVVAPDRERSACGHAMTMTEPLRVNEFDWGDAVKAYSVTGVPVDCVNVGLSHLYPDGCDLVLSGFNHGPNLGFDVTYSGTVAGAMEGAINGIHSIAFSMARFSGKENHFESGSSWLKDHFEWLLSLKLPQRTFLNINLPAMPYDEIKEARFVKMGGRVYRDRVEQRMDPWDRPYFWQGGLEIGGNPEPGTDFEAVVQGHVSITPISLNWTDNIALVSLQNSAIPTHQV